MDDFLLFSVALSYFVRKLQADEDINQNLVQRHARKHLAAVDNEFLK